MNLFRHFFTLRKERGTIVRAIIWRVSSRVKIIRGLMNYFLISSRENWLNNRRIWEWNIRICESETDYGFSFFNYTESYGKFFNHLRRDKNSDRRAIKHIFRSTVENIRYLNEELNFPIEMDFILITASYCVT